MRVLVLLLALLVFGLGAFVLLRNETPRQAGSGHSERTSIEQADSGTAPFDASSLDRLSKSVEGLRASVERLSQRLAEWDDRPESRPRGGQDSIVVDRFTLTGETPAHSRRDAAIGIRSAPEPERRKRFEELRGQPEIEVNRRHWLWTLSDAVQHYGPPDEIHPMETGRVDLVYRTGNLEHRLAFYDGLLLLVHVREN